MHRWSHRYFILNGPQLSYKIKKDSDKNRGSFDLVPGCIVTEVLEESIGAIKGKKIFSFWVVWPHDKREKEKQEKKNKKKKNSAKKNGKDKGSSIDNKSDKSDNEDEGHKSNNEDESDDDEEDDEDDDGNKIEEVTAIPIKQKKDDDKKEDITNKHHKDLKHIVETEVMTVRQQQKQVEEQLERHHAHDKSVSLGVKVAAVAVGGVVIGALTAGIGLIPYITVVGITAVVGGGAVLAVRKPSDSRLILAAETMWDALAWKNAIEMEIRRLEENRKPILPSSTDPNIISFLMGTSINSQTWKKICIIQGMRIMQQLSPMEDTVCRRAQLIITVPPVTVFLGIMEGNCWPKDGSVKVVKVIDDHADIIEITTNKSYRPGKYFGKMLMPSRKLYFNRFWKLDDDGIYLIALTSCDCNPKDDVNTLNDDKVKSPNSNDNNKSNNMKGNNFDPAITAVLTVSPRRDHVEYYEDLSISLVSCTCQVSTRTSWKRNELDNFINDFLIENLLELQQLLIGHKYSLEERHKNSELISLALPTTTNEVNTKSIQPKKGKIATVQPGLEEMGMINVKSVNIIPRQRSMSDVGNDKSTSTILPASKQEDASGQPKKRRLFKTTFGSGFVETPTKSVTDDDKKTPIVKKRFLFKGSSSQSETKNDVVDVSTEAKPPSTLSKVIGRRRNKVNTEASAIRSQIAAKEYEIQRLERLKRKDTSIEFDSSLKKLQSELVTLKNRYFTLTDEHYEQSRRGLNRFINSENKKDIKSMDKVEYRSDHKIPSSIESNSNQKVPVASLIKNNNEIKSGDKKEIKAKEANEVILGRPLHWQPWHPEQVSAESSFFFHETFASVDARVNIVMVLMFSLSMIAAMLLANILSQF